MNKGNKLSRGSVMISPSRDERTDLIFEIGLKNVIVYILEIRKDNEK